MSQAELSAKISIKKENKVIKEIKKNFPLFLMLLPGALLIIIFHYLPMFGIVIAFKRLNYSAGIFNSPWVGLDNFKFMFSTPDAWVITRNTLCYNIVWLVLGLVIAVTLAISLNEIKNKYLSKVYQTLLIMPYFLSWVIVSYLVLAFLNMEHGLINKMIFEPLGIKPLDWYSTVGPWPFILTIVNIWKYAGYNSVVYLAAIAGIDPELYEAAKIDGATRWQQIRNITIPSLTTLIIILSIMAVGKIFNADFGLFYQVPLNSGPLYPVTNVIDTYVFNTLRSGSSGSIGMSAAAGLYQALCGFILVIVTNAIVRKIDDEKSLF